MAIGTVVFIQFRQTDKAVASSSVANFTAVREKKSVVISWMTYSEVNNSYFTIERSANGTDFEAITRVDGITNSNALRKYEFRDKDPLPKQNYYRLRQVDMNGNSKFSNIISTIATSNVKEVKITRVHPNPFDDQFTVDFISPANQQFSLMLLSGDGKIVHEQPVTGIKGTNSVLVKPDSLLKKGTYFIPLVFGNEVVGASRVNHQ